MSELIFTAPGLAAFALLLGHLLTKRFAFLQRFVIPPSLTGGALLLLFGPEVTGLFPARYYEAWRAWPTVLITFLFIGIILGERPETLHREGVPVRDIVRQTLFVWFIAFTQLALGFAITLFVLVPLGAPVLVAHIIEIGWIGGHGAAGAFSAIAEELGQPEAGALGVFSATAGLIVGGTVGLVLVHRFRSRRDGGDRPAAAEAAEGNESPQTTGTLLEYARSGESLFAAIVLFLFVALVASFLRDGLAAGAGAFGRAALAKLVAEFPLFSLALLVAVFLRTPFVRLRLHDPGVARQAGFLTGIVLEFLILTATATLRLSAAAEQLPAFLMLMAAATIWTVVLLLVFAPRFLPRDCWQELGILNYGMSTGVTAVGLMLVRSLRGEVSSRVARIYGLSAPFSAPLVGGGAISLLLPRLTAEGHGWSILVVLVVLSTILAVVGVGWQRR